MSIVAADLVPYASANVPDTDAGTAGGAIDTLRRVDFTQLAANDTIEALSSAAGDTTQTLTIEARKADGTVVSETKTLTGTTVVTFSVNGVVERILKAELSAVPAGVITVRRAGAGATVRTIPVGERGFVMIFRKTASQAGSTTNYYEKFFWKNTNGVNALTTAQVTESADPDARITHALDATVGASTSVATRITSPGFTFDGTAKTVPGNDLGAGLAIGVWLNLTLPAADPAHRTTYTSQLAGNTT